MTTDKDYRKAARRHEPGAGRWPRTDFRDDRAVVRPAGSGRHLCRREPITTPLLRSFGGFSKPYKEFLGAVGLFGIGDFADTFYILYAVSVLSPQIGADASAGCRHLGLAR